MSECLIAEALQVERAGAIVLRDFELRARAGEVIALVGPNGAGKSSALKALCGLLPSSGSVRVHGRLLSELSLRQRARAIAYVPQHSRLEQGLSARDIVAQGRYAHDSSWFGLQGKSDRAVDHAIEVTQLGALSERRWSELSGGEQRRVLLARALASEAEIVMLDEPTAALDVAHAARFLMLLRRLAASGRCILLVLHDLEQVRRCADRALLIDRGRVIASGPPKQVIAPAPIAQVYGVTLEENAAIWFHLPEER
ncbi:MAG TPA: ABC transporter ATP-binding protein [Polyangiales bacterium]